MILEYQNDWPISFLEVSLRVDVDNTGKQKRKRFSGTCLRDSHHIATAQSDGPALDLGGGLNFPVFFDPALGDGPALDLGRELNDTHFIVRFTV
jgi:hypothetical protein